MTENDKQTNKITLGLIVSWGLGGLLLISGVVGVFEDPVMGIFTILASTFLLPPVREQIYQKTNKSLSGGLRAVIVISLVVMGAMSSQEYQANYQSIQNSTNASVSELLGHA